MARAITLPGDVRDSSVFSGTTSGESVRELLHLNNEDTVKENIEILVPSGTSYIDDAFLRGLLEKSVVKLKGISNFKKKYNFISLDNNPTVKAAIEEGIQNGLKRIERRTK